VAGGSGGPGGGGEGFGNQWPGYSNNQAGTGDDGTATLGGGGGGGGNSGSSQGGSGGSGRVEILEAALTGQSYASGMWKMNDVYEYELEGEWPT